MPTIQKNVFCRMKVPASTASTGPKQANPEVHIRPQRIARSPAASSVWRSFSSCGQTQTRVRTKCTTRSRVRMHRVAAMGRLLRSSRNGARVTSISRLLASDERTSKNTGNQRQRAEHASPAD